MQQIKPGEFRSSFWKSVFFAYICNPQRCVGRVARRRSAKPVTVVRFRYAPPECASEVVLGHIAFKIYTKLILNFVGCTTREGSAFLVLFKCPTIPPESNFLLSGARCGYWRGFMFYGLHSYLFMLQK